MAGHSSGPWGWHRLAPSWASRLVADAAIGPGDLVLDIGAGTGALTAPLVAAGALAALDRIVTGLRWKAAQPPLSVVGPPTKADLDACWELGAAVSAGLALDG